MKVTIKPRGAVARQAVRQLYPLPLGLWMVNGRCVGVYMRGPVTSKVVMIRMRSW